MQSAGLPTLPSWGLGVAASPFQHLQNRTEVGQRLTPGQRHGLPAQEQNAFPGPGSDSQRLGGLRRKEMRLHTALVSMHPHVKPFSLTVEGVVEHFLLMS